VCNVCIFIIILAAITYGNFTFCVNLFEVKCFFNLLNVLID